MKKNTSLNNFLLLNERTNERKKTLQVFYNHNTNVN